jgi:D-alanine--poly(phosphoribitol) ligase subunit 2
MFCCADWRPAYSRIFVEGSLQQEILTLIYSAMDEVDAQTTAGAPVEKSPEARLLGSDQGVDSLTFVNLVVAIEEQIQKKMGKSVVLVDEDNMALEEHPFRTIGTLADYIEKIVAKPQLS